MKRFINILLLIFGISFVLILVSGIINVKCIFKYLFNISCPGCGLTRSFRAIIDLNFYSAFNYNILGIPLFIIGIVVCIGIIIDIVKNDNRTIMLINNLLKKYYVSIVILIIITMIVNNMNGI